MYLLARIIDATALIAVLYLSERLGMHTCAYDYIMIYVLV